MAVYVDQPIFHYGRMIMCHMWADTPGEMHEMAARVGVARKHFQEPPKASWQHYDICKQKRALALKYGAVEVDAYEALYQQAKKNGRPVLMKDIENLRARKAALK